jgi:Protein of unknown function (DUF3631)
MQMGRLALSPLEKWQTELAREAAAGRGIDALSLILSELKEYYARDQNGGDLQDTIQQMNDCAHRHLEGYNFATIEAIFDGVFSSTVINNVLDDIAITHDNDAEIRRLANLSLVKYDRERKALALRMGVRPSTLDLLVKAARPQDKKGQGRTFELPSIEPWPVPVNGAELLGEICGAIRRYIVLPRESADTLALWALHTHCFNCFEHSPRLAIISPEKGCGKTTTLDVLSCLVARPLSTSNATVAAIFRIIERDAPTLLIDEADTFLKENDELRGILNAGHRRGGQITRTVGDDHEPRLFSTWAPAAIAMIGRLPDTLNDRSVVVSLRRRKQSEQVESFRIDRTEHLKVLQKKMTRWAEDHHAGLAALDPDMGELVNRVADNWRPLFAIAKEAGGGWSERVREVASTAVKAMREESTNVQLFGHIKWIFDGSPEGDRTAPIDRIASAELVERLIKIEAGPWAEWKGGKPLTQNSLARLLNKFDILSGTIRIGNDTAKGYYRTAFEDVFGRYLPPQTVTTSQVNNHGHCHALQTVTPENLVTVSKLKKSNNDGHCDGVTVVGRGIGKNRGNGTPERRCSHCGHGGGDLQEICYGGDVSVLLHRDCQDAWRAAYGELEKRSREQNRKGQAKAAVRLLIPDDLSIPEFLRVDPSVT